MDIPVQIALYATEIALLISTIYFAIESKTAWQYWLLSIISLFAFLIIAYGLYSQCPDVAVYRRC